MMLDLDVFGIVGKWAHRSPATSICTCGSKGAGQACPCNALAIPVFAIDANLMPLFLALYQLSSLEGVSPSWCLYRCVYHEAAMLDLDTARDDASVLVPMFIDKGQHLVF